MAVAREQHRRSHAADDAAEDDDLSHVRSSGDVHELELEGRPSSLAAPCATALEKFMAQPTLADSRLSHNSDDPCVARERLLQRHLKYSHLVLAADELREAACARHVEAGMHPSDAFEFEDTDRLRQTPHLVPT